MNFAGGFDSEARELDAVRLNPFSREFSRIRRLLPPHRAEFFHLAGVAGALVAFGRISAPARGHHRKRSQALTQSLLPRTRAFSELKYASEEARQLSGGELGIKHRCPHVLHSRTDRDCGNPENATSGRILRPSCTSTHRTTQIRRFIHHAAQAFNRSYHA